MSANRFVFRGISAVLVVAVSMGSATGIAAADASAVGGASASHSTSLAMQGRLSIPGSDSRFDDLIEKLRSVPAGASPEEAAKIIYPNDPEGRAEYIRLVMEFADHKNPSSRAIPAALAMLGPPLALCVAGGLGSAAVNELIVLVRTGESETAHGRVNSAVGGCITTVVPPALRPAANAAKPQIVAMITALIIRFTPKVA